MRPPSEAVLRNEIELKLDVIDERLLMSNLQKIATRIALVFTILYHDPWKEGRRRRWRRRPGR